MLVDAVEVAAGPRLDVSWRIPADLIAHEEICMRGAVLRPAVVQIHRMIEVGVGGGHHAVGVGRGVVNGVDHSTAPFRSAVAAQPQEAGAQGARSHRLERSLPL